VNTFELTEKLTSIMSVSGFEDRGAEELVSFFKEPFDEYIPHSSKTHIFVKKSKKENAPRLMIDAHFDEIGMIVTDISDDGFLSVTSLGGIDRRSLPASEVLIYGKETIYGVIVSTPPHLQAAGDWKKVSKMDSVRIDTGYSGDALREIVSIGTPVGFYEKAIPLANGRICSRSLDNKACCAAAYLAAASLTADEMECDLYVTLSSREETGGSYGATTAAYMIKPHIAIITDVTFGRAPGVKEEESGKLGGGPVISLSAVTDKRLTADLRRLCEENGIEYSVTVDATDTGTNATLVSLTGDGIATAVCSVPIGSMHTYSETASLSDIESCARLFALAAKTRSVF